MASLKPTDTIAVIGAGTMGAGITQIAAKAGHEVLLYDVNKEAIEKGIKYISSGLKTLVDKNKMSSEERKALLQRIKPVDDLSYLYNARLVIEAIIEDIEIKRLLFVQLEDICDKNTYLASNTSSISITAIAASLQRPQNFSGMHFFNPAPIMKLVEIVSGLATTPEVAQTIFDTATFWGKKPVHVKSTPGFIVNRVARPYYAEALRSIEESASNPSTIDMIMRSAGFRMGPFELMDLIGHDVNYAVTQSMFTAYYNDQRFIPSLVQKELIDAGYLGRKSDRGFYDYSVNLIPEADLAPLGPKPQNITIYGDLHSNGESFNIIQPLIKLLTDNKFEISFEQSNSIQMIIDGIHLAITDGRTATERSSLEKVDNFILFDLTLDFLESKCIAITAADQASPEAMTIVSGMFQSIGKSVAVIDDIPGMLVMRTICMLANEGADTVNQGICDAIAVDTAIQNGVNYPLGPLAWADRIGIETVVNVLSNIGAAYGEDRYRVSPLLKRKSHSGNPFFK